MEVMFKYLTSFLLLSWEICFRYYNSKKCAWKVRWGKSVNFELLQKTLKTDWLFLNFDFHLLMLLKFTLLGDHYWSGYQHVIKVYGASFNCQMLKCIKVLMIRQTLYFSFWMNSCALVNISKCKIQISISFTVYPLYWCTWMYWIEATKMMKDKST